MSKYGFYDRLNENFPSQINVDLTNVCNLNCIHCAHSKTINKPGYKQKHLDPALNKKMIDEIPADGDGICEYVRYTADGEPLFHPDIFDILRYAVRNCNAKITLTTNGTLLNDENIARLIDTGLHSIDISIDAHSEATYRVIRRNGDFERTKQNVLKLIKAKGEVKIFVSFIRQTANENEAAAFENFWKENGADYAVIRRLHSFGGVLEQAEIDSNTPRTPCIYPWERIILTEHGKLTFCPVYSGREDLVLSDFESITIKEAWQSERMKQVRAAHLSCDFRNVITCSNCTDWQRVKWPDEGRSYASLMREV